jgi:hypothetical protein
MSAIQARRAGNGARPYPCTASNLQIIDYQQHASFEEFFISPFVFNNIAASICPENCNALILRTFPALFHAIYKGPQPPFRQEIRRI